MARTTEDEVRAIIDTDITTDQMTQYITSASTMIDGLFSNVSITDAMLVEIERWLTAHLIASSRERQAKEEGAGGAYIKYSMLYGTGLKSSSYGQHAILLDYTGTLEKAGGGKTTFFAIEGGYE